MSPSRIPTEDEAPQAVDRLLADLDAGEDVFDALDELRQRHPEHSTFPGEVFMRLAAHALAEGEVSGLDPISDERLVREYLPECTFRGRDNRKIRYALLVCAATSGGVEVVGSSPITSSVSSPAANPVRTGGGGGGRWPGPCAGPLACRRWWRPR